jgi:hypothetical protein
MRPRAFPVLIACLAAVVVIRADDRPAPRDAPAPPVRGPLNVLDYGARADGEHDDAPAIQAAIDACRPGGVVYLPAGRYRLTRGLVTGKPLTIRGDGAESDSAAEFGHPAYGTPNETGTILECTARAGYAIDHVVAYPIRLEGFVLKGIGDDSRTTRGIRIGKFLGQSCRSRVREVLVMNFAVGLEANGNYDSDYHCLGLTGCDRGAWIESNQCVYTSTDVKACRIGVYLDGGQVNVFLGGAVQGTTGTGVLIAPNSQENVLQGIYFENKDAEVAIDARGESTNILACHYSTPKDHVRISGDWSRITPAKYGATLTITGRGVQVLGVWGGQLEDRGRGTVVFGDPALAVNGLAVRGAVSASSVGAAGHRLAQDTRGGAPLNAMTVESNDTSGASLRLMSTAPGGHEYLLLSTARGAGAGPGKLQVYDVAERRTLLLLDAAAAALPVAAAGAAYGATERKMLQGVYDAVKALLPRN